SIRTIRDLRIFALGCAGTLNDLHEAADPLDLLAIESIRILHHDVFTSLSRNLPALTTVPDAKIARENNTLTLRLQSAIDALPPGPAQLTRAVTSALFPSGASRLGHELTPATAQPVSAAPTPGRLSQPDVFAQYLERWEPASTRQHRLAREAVWFLTTEHTQSEEIDFAATITDHDLIEVIRAFPEATIHLDSAERVPATAFLLHLAPRTLKLPAWRDDCRPETIIADVLALILSQQKKRETRTRILNSVFDSDGTLSGRALLLAAAGRPNPSEKRDLLVPREAFLQHLRTWAYHYIHMTTTQFANEWDLFLVSCLKMTISTSTVDSDDYDELDDHLWNPRSGKRFFDSAVLPEMADDALEKTAAIVNVNPVSRGAFYVGNNYDPRAWRGLLHGELRPVDFVLARAACEELFGDASLLVRFVEQTFSSFSVPVEDQGTEPPR
ncbi:MAG: hypothetical protein LBM66_05965, partial [Bifidobacteriaceae bacterium]|nr:hypothetical protein [Bifidobacteriaceae bacterium]